MRQYGLARGDDNRLEFAHRHLVFLMGENVNKNLQRLAAALVLSTTAVAVATAADTIIPQVSGTYTVEAYEPLPWYASAKIGVALPGTINMTATAPALPDLNGDATFNPGIAGAVALGKYLTPNVRAEVELALANNPGNSFTGTFVGFPGQTTGSLTGSVTTTTLMAMGYYEFTQFDDLVPYLSAGVGVANVNSNLTYNDPGALGFPINGTITGNSMVIAGRIGAGFQYALSDSLDITADYTALLGSRATLTYTDVGGVFTRNVSAGVMGHALAIGIKGRF